MTNTLRTAAVVLLTVATAAPAFAQPKDKPRLDAPTTSAPYVYPSGAYWYAPGVQMYGPPYAPSGTYYTVYAASRPVVVVLPTGPVMTTTPTAPVVVGPTWALAPVAQANPYSYGWSNSWAYNSTGYWYGGMWYPYWR
jgi:hypothetical protein